MCETFTFFHICGHVHSKKKCKCTEEIERQVDQAAAFDSLHRRPDIRAGSCREDEQVESFLKPSLCAKCEDMGIIGDWLRNDPTMRFEIVREWLRRKREGTLCTGEGNGAGTEKSGDITESTGARTLTKAWPPYGDDTEHGGDWQARWQQLSPSRSRRLDKSRVSQVSVAQDQPETAALETMALVLTDYLSQARTIDAEANTIEAKLKEDSRRADEAVQRSIVLRTRTAEIRTRMTALMPETRDPEDQPHVALKCP